MPVTISDFALLPQKEIADLYSRRKRLSRFLREFIAWSNLHDKTYTKVIEHRQQQLRELCKKGKGKKRRRFAEHFARYLKGGFVEAGQAGAFQAAMLALNHLDLVKSGSASKDRKIKD